MNKKIIDLKKLPNQGAVSPEVARAIEATSPDANSSS